MYFPSNLKVKLFPILVSRTVIFFFVLCLLTLFLYAAGTVQGFIDSTQLTLLSVYVVLGIFLTIASIGGVIVNLGRYFKNRKVRYVFRAGGYMLLIIFGAISVLAVLFIITVASGNSGR